MDMEFPPDRRGTGKLAARPTARRQALARREKQGLFERHLAHLDLFVVFFEDGCVAIVDFLRSACKSSDVDRHVGFAGKEIWVGAKVMYEHSIRSSHGGRCDIAFRAVALRLVLGKLAAVPGTRMHEKALRAIRLDDPQIDVGGIGIPRYRDP